MAVCIKLKSGASWYSNDDLPTVRGQIERGEPIKVWWFMAWGQRYAETVVLEPDELAYLITESDDG